MTYTLPRSCCSLLDQLISKDGACGAMMTETQAHAHASIMKRLPWAFLMQSVRAEVTFWICSGSLTNCFKASRVVSPSQ